MKIAVVVSEFNQPVTSKLREGCLGELARQGVEVALEDVIEVPGAVELPLMAQCFARTKRYDAVICLGVVIRGETTHYDYVCQQVSYGCQRVALDYNLPVVFGVLTTENSQQAFDRLGGTHGHKGIDAAKTAIAMIQCVNIESLQAV